MKKCSQCHIKKSNKHFKSKTIGFSRGNRIVGNGDICGECRNQNKLEEQKNRSICLDCNLPKFKELRD